MGGYKDTPAEETAVVNVQNHEEELWQRIHPFFSPQ